MQVILAAGALVSRWIGALVSAQLARRQMEPPMQQLVVRVVRVIVMLFALVVALDKLGFQVAPLVAGIGVAGLGIGIALQGGLSNVVAGMNIIFSKPFRVGEHIADAGVKVAVRPWVKCPTSAPPTASSTRRSPSTCGRAAWG